MSENNTPSPVDDGRSAVAGTRGREMSMGTKFGILGLIGVVTMGFVWFNALYSHKAKEKQAQSAAYGGGGEVYTPPPPVVTKPAPVPLPAPPDPTSPGLGFNGQPQQTPAAAPIMAYSGSDNIVPAFPPPAAPAPGVARLVFRTVKLSGRITHPSRKSSNQRFYHRNQALVI